MTNFATRIRGALSPVPEPQYTLLRYLHTSADLWRQGNGFAYFCFHRLIAPTLQQIGAGKFP